MSDAEWNNLIELLLELGATDFCVFGETDEAASIVDRLIEIAVEETLR